jgi:hypothetical protein
MKIILTNILKVSKARATLTHTAKTSNSKGLMSINKSQKFQLKWLLMAIIGKLSSFHKKMNKIYKGRLTHLSIKELANSMIRSLNTTIKTLSPMIKEGLNKNKNKIYKLKSTILLLLSNAGPVVVENLTLIALLNIKRYVRRYFRRRESSLMFRSRE